MSYCRWSSDDYQCDVYVYEAYEGFRTHVATARRVFNVPLPPRVPASDLTAYIVRAAEVTRLCKQSTLVPIALPEAGASFTHGTAAECADNLERLRTMGFHVPQYAIDALVRGDVGDREEGAE